ncbi:MAG: T9SS type A sorting domain-containing protein [Ignavibacteria bacterium]|nr:T9SS type A sorting domain-containing protein [Ignavibacteria bacterium]
MNHTSHTRAVRFLSSLLYFFSIFIFINAFNFQHNPPGAWRQQFMPEIQGLDIADVVFLDSLTGYAVAKLNYILKTTNGGENWSIIYEDTTTVQFIFARIQFISENEGFAGGFFGLNYGMMKTTDAGQNWSRVNTPTFAEDIFVLSSDTIWFVCTEGLTGGVFRTTNGGASWQRLWSQIGQNPDKIHMLNANTGFCALNSGLRYVRRTTNGGFNWNDVDNNQTFYDIYFADSLKGWFCGIVSPIKATTNGGLNWFSQILPSGGNVYVTPFFSMSNVGSDSLWGVGGICLFGLPSNGRGMLYFTSNGGINWVYQLPDTSIHIGQYWHVDFEGKMNGWAYRQKQTGIHTTTGGDTTFTSVRQISDILPGDFILHQNYPNPFNGSTKIRFEINKKATVSIGIFDITGKKLVELVNKQFTSGQYEVDYTTNENSSGVYFYSLSVDGTILDTKKMIVLK